MRIRTRLDAQIAWSQFEQDAADAKAAKPFVDAAISIAYFMDVAGIDKNDFEFQLSPDSPAFPHIVMKINKDTAPDRMRLVGIPLVVDLQVKDWSIRQRVKQ